MNTYGYNFLDSYELPDPDYRGPIFGPDWKPSERETLAETLDRKCNDQHIDNERLRNL